jgi:hypothetical protein
MFTVGLEPPSTTLDWITIQKGMQFYINANFSHSTVKSPVELRAAIEMRKKAIINGGGGRGDGEWGYCKDVNREHKRYRR